MRNANSTTSTTATKAPRAPRAPKPGAPAKAATGAVAGAPVITGAIVPNGAPVAGTSATAPQAPATKAPAKADYASQVLAIVAGTKEGAEAAPAAKVLALFRTLPGSQAESFRVAVRGVMTDLMLDDKSAPAKALALASRDMKAAPKASAPVVRTTDDYARAIACRYVMLTDALNGAESPAGAPASADLDAKVQAYVKALREGKVTLSDQDKASNEGLVKGILGIWSKPVFRTGTNNGAPKATKQPTAPRVARVLAADGMTGRNADGWLSINALTKRTGSSGGAMKVLIDRAFNGTKTQAADPAGAVAGTHAELPGVAMRQGETEHQKAARKARNDGSSPVTYGFRITDAKALAAFVASL